MNLLTHYLKHGNSLLGSLIKLVISKDNIFKLISFLSKKSQKKIILLQVCLFLFFFGCLLVPDISVAQNKKWGGPKEFLAKPHRNQKLSAKGDGGKKNGKKVKNPLPSKWSVSKMF